MDTPIEEASEEESTTEIVEDDTSLETTEESTDTVDDTSEDETQEDAVALQKRISDKDIHIVKLEKENKKLRKAEEKPDTRPDDIKELEWRLTHKDRISLVQEEYDTIVDEGFEGETVSNTVALELAEKQAKIDTSDPKRERQNDISTTSTTVRNDLEPIQLTESDIKFGMTVERKRALEKKHPHLKEPL